MPVTKSTNKHLLPVGYEPMIYHGIRKLVVAGINDILIVTGKDHAGAFIDTLGDGSNLDAYNGPGLKCNLTYRVQERHDGIGGALQLAESFIGEDSLCVLLGDNIFYERLFFPDRLHPRIFLSRVPDPERFGVAEIVDGRIVSIVEKPEFPRSDLAITGIYYFPSQHVFEVAKALQPSSRGELEITEIHNFYLHEAKTLQYTMLAGWWTDAGTHETLHNANVLMRREPPRF